MRQDKYNKTNRKTKLYACNHCHECPYKELCAKNKDRREFREHISPAVEEAKFFLLFRFWSGILFTSWTLR